MDAAAVEKKLQEILHERADTEGVAAAWLFGSVARGTAGPRSDVDVGVLYDHEPPLTLEGLGLNLEWQLESALGIPVQLVVLNHASVDLIVRVLRDGRLLVDRDRARRIQFEVRSRNEFWDLEPYLRLYRHQGVLHR